MKKNILFWLIIISVKTQAQSVWRAEILGRPTDKSITVQAFFDTTTEMCVQYGTSSGTYPNQTPWQTFAFNTPAEITVTGLNPNTQYYYRVCYRKPLSTPFKSRPEHTFHTARPKGETFTRKQKH